jgi:hypothetical protein
MRDMSDEAQSLETPPLDPYGDVALGVECAWPTLIRVEESLEDLAS